MGKRRGWERMRPHSNELLESLLRQERKITARWYERISGQAPWKDGERELLNQMQDDMALQVDHLIGRQEKTPALTGAALALYSPNSTPEPQG